MKEKSPSPTSRTGPTICSFILLMAAGKIYQTCKYKSDSLGIDIKEYSWNAYFIHLN